MFIIWTALFEGNRSQPRSRYWDMIISKFYMTITIVIVDRISIDILCANTVLYHYSNLYVYFRKVSHKRQYSSTILRLLICGSSRSKILLCMGLSAGVNVYHGWFTTCSIWLYIFWSMDQIRIFNTIIIHMFIFVMRTISTSYSMVIK